MKAARLKVRGGLLIFGVATVAVFGLALTGGTKWFFEWAVLGFGLILVGLAGLVMALVGLVQGAAHKRRQRGAATLVGSGT